ncbi:MAG TPA: hypothetical protein DDY49_03970 [Paenibacillaceae bacterium]|nr:hypothetical protein [Paenibacillaceae bacterium]
MKNMFKLSYIIMVIFTLSACNVNLATHPDESAKKEMVVQIKNYYKDIEEGYLSGKAQISLEADKESKSKIARLGNYVIKHGYKVALISEPNYITYEEPYAIYEVTIKVKYPDDYQSELKEDTIKEKLWLNPETRLITKIESEDEFLYSRIASSK